MHATYLHCVEILVIWRDVEPLVRRPEYVVDNFDFGLFFEGMSGDILIPINRLFWRTIFRQFNSTGVAGF